MSGLVLISVSGKVNALSLLRSHLSWIFFRVPSTSPIILAIGTARGVGKKFKPLSNTDLCCSLNSVYIVSVCLLSITYATDEDGCIAVETFANKIFKTSIGEMLHEIWILILPIAQDYIHLILRLFRK